MCIVFTAFLRCATLGNRLRQTGLLEERISQIALHRCAELNSSDVRYAVDTLRHLLRGTS